MSTDSKKKGTTRTPFDMAALNRLDRFHLAADAIDRVPGLKIKAAEVRQQFCDKLIEHTRWVRENGEACLRSGSGPGFIGPRQKQATDIARSEPGCPQPFLSPTLVVENQTREWATARQASDQWDAPFKPARLI